MSDPQAQFEGLLSNLLSSDNASRVQAEKVYMNTKKTQPNEVVQALLQVGRTSSNPSLRSMAIVLLRRALINLEQEQTLWKKLNPQIQLLLKQQLLQGVEQEEEPHVRTGFCEAATCLAGDLFEEDETWEGFIEWLLRMVHSPHERHVISAFSMLSNLSLYLQGYFKEGNFTALHQLLNNGLCSPQVETRVAALGAVQSFIPVFVKAEYRKSLQGLLPPILDTIAHCLNHQDQENARTCVRHLISVSEMDPGFFRPTAPIVVNAMLKISMSTQLEDDTRQLALEFLVSLVENKPKMCQNIEGFVKHLVHTLIQWMLDLPEIPLEEWNERAENEDDEVDVENSIIAEEALDRISISLDGEVIVPIIFEHIPAMCQNPDWKQRYVALMTLSMVGEGCHDVLKPHLANIVSLLLPLFHDPHPRVRWAAANTAGQMATDFGPKLQKQFHSEFLPRFISLMEDAQNPKVRSHTAAAIVNFCEKFDAATLAPYLNPLLSKLLALLKDSNKNVQETALTAVASVAGCAGKYFTDYYNWFVPILKEILVNASSNEQRMLRGKAMECISLIGVAVGKETFGNDVGPLVELLANIKTSELEADDPLRDFILQTWIRISACLGHDFVPYLKLTMPQVLASAALDCSFSVSDSSLLAADDEEPGWEVVDVGDTRIKIHTLALEEKANACSLLLTFACEMKEDYFPFVQDISKLIVPLLTFYFHDGVRIACLSMVPHLLNSVKLYVEKQTRGDNNYLTELFNFVFPPLLESVRDDTETEVLVTGIEAIHESLTVMGSGCLSLVQVKEIVHDIFLLIRMSRNRREDLCGRNPDADADDSTLIRDEVAKEDELLRELAEVIGALVKHHPDSFMEAFQLELFPVVGELIQKNRAPAERQLALCIFDDVVEHGKERSFNLWDLFMPFMLDYATDPNPEVRQASCYGLGVCAQQGGDRFKPYARKALELLISVINQPDSRNEKNAPPTENAISSVGKIIHYQSSELGTDVPELLKLWLSWLPLEVDDIEAKAVHQHLFTFILSNHPHIFGHEFGNLPKILSVFAFLLRDHEPPLVEDKQVVKNILAQMQQQMPGELLAGAFSVLTPEEKAVLQNV